MTCATCGRSGLGTVVPQGGPRVLRVRFHYAPCGLPCEGGYISSEERTYHRRFHGRGCLAPDDPMVVCNVARVRKTWNGRAEKKPARLESEVESESTLPLEALA